MAIPSGRSSRSRRLVIIAVFIATSFLLLSGSKERTRPSVALPEGFGYVLADDPCTSPDADQSAGADQTAASPLGGDLSPVRYVIDPYPTFNGIALDPQNDRIVLSDENRKSILTYDRTSGRNSAAVTSPVRQIMGPHTEIGYIAGIELDPAHRELYAVNNDIEDRIAVFDDSANGDFKPKRFLYVPHQTWGLSLNPERDEMAVSVQQLAMVAIYKRDASGMDAPLRVIRGPATGMADPHGIRWDAAHHEIVVANHGNYSVITPYSAYDTAGSNIALALGGHFLEPSITTFAETAKGDAKPLRSIQGPRTGLNWPMGIDIDKGRDEIAVANNGDNSVLVFRRGADGNVSPLRVIKGPHTGIAGPMGVAIDPKNGELWVANYADHTALVFSPTAKGDVTPRRIIRNAPAHTPTGGFGNPYAVAYDSKRQQLLVPN